MNEREFNWDDLRLFLAVARHEGLAPAAAEIGKSAPTLGRRMLALERQLGRPWCQAELYYIFLSGMAVIFHFRRVFIISGASF